MSTNLRVMAIVAVIILLGLGGWWIFNNRVSTSQPTSTVSPSPTGSVPPATPSAPSAPASTALKETIVKISQSGFSPKIVTIKVGESVTWTNTDSVNHTVNSDLHPTHLLYPALNLGVITPGGQKSLVFSKTGTFTYHDHLNPSLTGTVTVQ